MSESPKRKHTEKARNRPTNVDRAIYNDNVPLLRILGRKGAEVAAKNRTDKEELSTYYREKEVERADVEAERAAEINREHISPLDNDERE